MPLIFFSSFICYSLRLHNPTLLLYVYICMCLLRWICVMATAKFSYKLEMTTCLTAPKWFCVPHNLIFIGLIIVRQATNEQNKKKEQAWTCTTASPAMQYEFSGGVIWRITTSFYIFVYMYIILLYYACHRINVKSRLRVVLNRLHHSSSIFGDWSAQIVCAMRENCSQICEQRWWQTRESNKKKRGTRMPEWENNMCAMCLIARVPRCLWAVHCNCSFFGFFTQIHFDYICEYERFGFWVSYSIFIMKCITFSDEQQVKHVIPIYK